MKFFRTVHIKGEALLQREVHNVVEAFSIKYLVINNIAIADHNEATLLKYTNSAQLVLKTFEQ